MERAIVAVVVAVLAVAAALVGRTRRPSAPARDAWPVPSQIDRTDFDAGDAPLAVVVFTAASCGSCSDALDRARRVAGTDVAVVEVEVGARPELHRRYRIEAVPATLVADADGVVQVSFMGPPDPDELAAAVRGLSTG